MAINLKLKGKGSCAKKGIAKIGNRKNIETGEMESVYLAVTTNKIGDYCPLLPCLVVKFDANIV